MDSHFSPSKWSRQTVLQLLLYSGIGLILLSVLFMSRGESGTIDSAYAPQETNAFLATLPYLLFPILFYGLGIGTQRLFQSSLAAPGIISTGAWLVAIVGVQLYDNLSSLSPDWRLPVWVAVMSAASVILTLTGYRLRFWMVIPLVPLSHLNLLWALLGALSVNVTWLPLLSYGLVLGWMVYPSFGDRWGSIYRVSAMFISAGLFFLSLWIPLSPPQRLLTAIAGGTLLISAGVRQDFVAAIHAGLWMIAFAWQQLYFLTTSDSNVYGVWMAGFAAGMLLLQRVMTTQRKSKMKTTQPIMNTLLEWPSADLALGLSVIIVIWCAAQVATVTPWLLAVTLGIVVGIWLVGGLLFRMPILIHAALWISPIPYMLILMYVSPTFLYLPTLGLAWQFLGIVLLIMGHAAPRYRPTILAPFFIVGYVLLGFGFGVAQRQSGYLPLSLTVLLVVWGITSILALLGRHPAWDAFLDRYVPFEKYPYAHNILSQAFLFLSAWVFVCWLWVIFPYTPLTFSQQGIALVGCAAIFFGLEVLLKRIQSGVSLPLASSAWLLWGAGLLHVFHYPTESLIAIGLGIVIAAGAYPQSHRSSWLLLIGVQLVFAGVQIDQLAGVTHRLSYAIFFLFGILLMWYGSAGEFRPAEFGGVLFWVMGIMVFMDQKLLIGVRSIDTVLHIGFLILYGAIDQRRIPLVIGLGIIGCGGLLVLIQLNGWFVPLLAGGVLIGLALLLETRGQWVEGVTQSAKGYWQSLR